MCKNSPINFINQIVKVNNDGKAFEILVLCKYSQGLYHLFIYFARTFLQSHRWNELYGYILTC